MLFNTFQFALFFAVVLLLHRSLPKHLRNRVLLAASLLLCCLPDKARDRLEARSQAIHKQPFGDRL